MKIFEPFRPHVVIFLSIIAMVDGREMTEHNRIGKINEQMDSICYYLLQGRLDSAVLKTCTVMPQWEADTSAVGDSLRKLYLPTIRIHAVKAAFDGIKKSSDYSDIYNTAHDALKSLIVIDDKTALTRSRLTKSNYEPIMRLIQDTSLSLQKRKILLAIADESGRSDTGLKAILIRNINPDTTIIDSLNKAKRFVEMRLWPEARRTYLDAVKTYVNAHPMPDQDEVEIIIEQLSYLKDDLDSGNFAGWNKKSLNDGPHRLRKGIKTGVQDLMNLLSVVIQFLIPAFAVLLLLCLQFFRTQSLEFIEDGGANSTGTGETPLKTLKTLIFSEVQSLNDGPSRFHTHLATGVSFNEQTIISVLPQNMVLRAIVTIVTMVGGFRISTRNRISLCVHTGASGRGPGVTVTISRNFWRKNISESFWIDKFMPDKKDEADLSTEMCIVLSKAIATWIMYCFHPRKMKRQCPMGSAQWKSYAFFLAGVHAYLQGRNAVAKKLYVFAINEDPKNFGAWYNLGFLYTQDAASESDPATMNNHYRLAITSLEKARHLTVSYKRKNDYSWRQIHYDSVLQLSAIHCCYINQNDNSSINELETIRNDLKNSDLKKMIGNKDSSFSEYIKEFQKAANCLNPNPPCSKCTASEKLEFSTSRAAYNSACCISEQLIQPADEPCMKKSASTALSYLDFALEMGGGITGWAKIDPSLKNLRDFSGTEFSELIKRHEKKQEPAAPTKENGKA